MFSVCTGPLFLTSRRDTGAESESIRNSLMITLTILATRLDSARDGIVLTHFDAGKEGALYVLRQLHPVHGGSAGACRIL
jgi:hypothetical protein